MKNIELWRNKGRRQIWTGIDWANKVIKNQLNVIDNQSNQSNIIDYQSNQFKVNWTQSNITQVRNQPFDWDSIAFDNQTTIIRSRSINFDWFDCNFCSNLFDWHLMVISYNPGDVNGKFLLLNRSNSIEVIDWTIEVIDRTIEPNQIFTCFFSVDWFCLI